eukprot:CAMPEP_0194027142 /NCGR_PEP_ID=MMETSP0009_2-20130614/1349_1 /TAXON_ID=210454 /ORGANISM="Grammatophora oceanica, Strain CCMP 410" /LENGTH=363 /DNA_ID=CAMNT_0038666099 /DNA_START=56 /DNA_END=1147 /DNA_ORIENTATION=-
MMSNLLPLDPPQEVNHDDGCRDNHHDSTKKNNLTTTSRWLHRYKIALVISLSMNLLLANLLLSSGPTDGEALCRSESMANNETAVLSSEQTPELYGGVTTDETTQGYKHAPVIYGHIHMAKTAGTTIAGEMASRLERVCGNKGYSLFFYQQNERRRRQEELEQEFPLLNPILNLQPQLAIGFENCDWVSEETRWENWATHFGTKEKCPFPLELHVPCKDPIEHLMSMQNYLHNNKEVEPLDCALNETAVFDQVRAILDCKRFTDGRFNSKLEHGFENIHLKCFDVSPDPLAYVRFMETKLQKRRLVVDYVFRPMNSPRDKTKECIWQHDALRERIREFIITNYDYHNYCSRCLGSSDELLLSS